MNRFITVLCLILGLANCTYETNSSEDEMIANTQQRSASGELTPGVDTQKVKMQVAPYFVNEVGERDAGNYTVQLNFADPNELAFSGDYIQARAEIVWSVAGNSVRRVVDCTDGMSITGTAEGVIVTIFDDSNITFSSVVPYSVGVQVAKGSRPSIQQPPVYSLGQIILLNPDSSTEILIPQNIGAVSMAVAFNPSTIDTPIPENSLRVQQKSGTTIRKTYDPRQEFWVPLIGGVDRIGLVTGPTAPAMEFQITLGIDG